MCNCTRQKKHTTSAMQSTEIIEWSRESQANALAPVTWRPEEYQQQIFMAKNYVVYQIRRTRLCNAKAKHQNERANERKRRRENTIHVMVESLLPPPSTSSSPLFFSPFLICHLFVVKTVHSAKLRAFYGARRYFPLQFHYFRVCLFLVPNKEAKR